MTYRKKYNNRRRARRVARAINYAGAFAVTVGPVVRVQLDPSFSHQVRMYLEDWERCDSEKEVFAEAVTTLVRSQVAPTPDELAELAQVTDHLGSVPTSLSV